MSKKILRRGWPVHCAFFPERRGMTLIELVAVMSLMVLLLTMAAMAFRSWTRSSGIRGSQAQLLSGLAGARELALTRRAEARFSATNLVDRGAFALFGPEGQVGPTNVFPRGVLFREDDDFFVGDIRFRSDGSGAGNDTDWPNNMRRLIIHEAHRPANRLEAAVVVHRLTGYAQAETVE